MAQRSRVPARLRIRAVMLATRWQLLAIERRWALAPAPVALGRSLGALGLVALPVWIVYDLLLPSGPYELAMFALATTLTIGLLRAPARWLNRFSMSLLVLGAIAMQVTAAASSGRADRLSGAWFLAIVLVVSIFVAPRVAALVAVLATMGTAVGLASQGPLDGDEYASLVASGALALLVGLTVSALSSRQRRSLRRTERRLARVRRTVALRRGEAYTDPLTGLGSRRRFDLDMAAALADRRAPGQVVLVFADLDGLKAINDTLGHPAGDDALRAIAAALRSAVRGSDNVYRIGGDEFAVLLVGATPAGVHARLGRSVATAMPGLGPLQASLGIAAARAADTPADLIARADRALYHVKRSLPGARTRG